MNDVLARYTQPYDIKCWSDVYLYDNVTEIIVPDNRCNDIASLDLSRYTELESITIGVSSFRSLNEFRIDGFEKLENLTIGEGSFTRNPNGADQYRKFYLMNCPLLKEVRIGHYAFADYAWSYVENLPSLELLLYGGGNSRNFFYVNYASFQSE